jgi:SAM-dependent methyltransferase
MTHVEEGEVFYTEGLIANLELRWGEGFLSPGGVDEVARLFEGIDIAGLDVLDVGCGVGGIDVLLASQYGARHILGLDVERPLLDRAREVSKQVGLADLLSFELVNPGPLPVEDHMFDVVFSKDAIIHIENKAELYAEAFRVIRPGGHLVIGDWFRGEDTLSEEMDLWIENNGVFSMSTLRQAAKLVEQAGFIGVQTSDRNDWYCGYARDELERIKGPLWEQYVELFGEEDAGACVEGAHFRMLVAEQGQLRPGHIRGRKPF